jgi:hypothetical protein
MDFEERNTSARESRRVLLNGFQPDSQVVLKRFQDLKEVGVSTAQS